MVHTHWESDTIPGVKKRLLFLIIIIIGLLAVPRVFAQSSDVATDQTAQRCALAQDYLGRIQKKRDLQARVDRLQAYQYIASRMDVFVTRLEKNNQPMAGELRGSVKKLNTEIKSFKVDYEAYDKSREEVVKVKDCRNNLSAFQARLDDARAKREVVHNDVIAIQDLLNPETRDQLSTLYTSLLATSKSGSVE